MTIYSPGGPGTAQPPPVKPKLLHLVRQAIRIRHYSPRTEQAYVHWIRRYIFFHQVRHPAEMGKPELNAFLSHLAVREHVSASTQTQALSALVFLYRNVLEREIGLLEGVVRAKRPARLPVVLTRDEARQLFAKMDGVVLLACRLLYGSGLRLLECLHLRVKDIEFERNEITVRDGKGRKDRVTMLPASCKQPLLDHLAKVRRQHEDDLRPPPRPRLPLHRSPHRRPPQASPARNRRPEGHGRGGAPRGDRQTGDASLASTFLRDRAAARGPRHPHHPGASGPQRREHHDDLHPRPEPRGPRRPKPRGRPVGGTVTRPA